MVTFGPVPQPGQLGEISIAGVSLRVNLGQYRRYEADRFGQKIAQGDLKYADFNPFESAATITDLMQGAGLRRESDYPKDENGALSLYTESSGVNCSGPNAILGPQQNIELLPGATSAVSWLGEIVPASGAFAGTRLLLAISGAQVYYRDASGDGIWHDTGLALFTAPIPAAVSVFQGTLIVGYGSAHTAQATSNLTSLAAITSQAGNPLYIWAATADHAASYVAGGEATTNVNQVLASVNAGANYQTPIVCGPSDHTITGLAPGGGIALLFVGKDNELGEITLAGTYSSLVPFNSTLSTNCAPLKWHLASGGDAQEGDVVLVFPRDRSLFTYTPSSVSSGSTQDIAPWAAPYLRPPNARGIITAIQGTARWLYFVTQSRAGAVFVWRRDNATGACHTYMSLGNTLTHALAVSTVTSLTGNPVLYVANGSNLLSVILPADGDSELDDPNCRFCPSGVLDLASLDFNFPDENKNAIVLRFVCDNLIPGACQIDVQASADGGPYVDMGVAYVSPAQSIPLPPTMIFKRLKLRLIFSTTDPTQTPQLIALSARAEVNPTIYRMIDFQASISSGMFSMNGADATQNPKTIIDYLWTQRQSQMPVNFTDPWGDQWIVRMQKMEDQWVLTEPDKSPEFTISQTLIVYAGPFVTGNAVYDAPGTVYDAPSSQYNAGSGAAIVPYNSYYSHYDNPASVYG